MVEIRYQPRKRSSGTREAIIAAAAEVFARQGYRTASLDQVAAAAGITKATIYYHFAAKEALYEELLTRHVSAALQELEAVLGSPNRALVRLRALLDGLLAGATDPAAKYIYYSEFVRVSPEVREAVRDAQHLYMDTITSLLTEAQTDGDVFEGDPKLLAMFLYEGIGRVPVWFDPTGRVGPAELAAIVRHFIVRGLLTESGLHRLDET